MLALLSFFRSGTRGVLEVTDSAVVLDGFGDEGVDEEGDFLIRWRHYDILSFLSGLSGGLGWGIEAGMDGCTDYGGARRR